MLQKPYLIEKPKELQTVSIHQDAIIRCGVKGKNYHDLKDRTDLHNKEPVHKYQID